MRRFTSRSLIFDATVTLRVALKNEQNTFARFRTQRNEYYSSQIDILCKKPLILYIDQFVEPAKLQ